MSNAEESSYGRKMWISMFMLLPSTKDVGNHLFVNHQYKKAIKTYNMALKKNPSFEIKLRIGISYYLIDDYLNAEKWLLEVQKSKSESQKIEAESILKEIYFKKGVCEFKEGNLESALFWFKEAQNRYGIASTLYNLGNKIEAKKIFQKLAKEETDVSCKSMYALGIIDYQEGQFKKALTWFKKLEPTNNVLEAIGSTLYRMKAYEEALDCFQKGNNDFFVAECYYKLGNFKKAEKYYKEYSTNEKLNQIVPTYENDALYGLAWSHYNLEKFDLSAKEFDQFSTNIHNSTFNLRSISMYYAGRSFLKDGKLDKSIKYFNEFLDEYPENELAVNSYYWLGKAYFAQGNYQSSMREFEELLSNHPNSIFSQQTYLMIGNIYYKTAKYDSAIIWYNYINNLSSDKSYSDWLLDEARFKIEECYFRLGEYGSRIDILRNFVRKYPKSKRVPKFEFELAKYWESQGNFREAIRTYKHIIQEFHWSFLAQNARLRLSECYFRIGSHNKAIEICEELIPTTLRIQAQTQLAKTYFLLAQYDKAIHKYEILVNDFPESDEAQNAQYQIGLCYEYLGSQKEARVVWQTFINKYPEDSKVWDVWLKLARTYWDDGLARKYEKTLLYIESSGEGRSQHEAKFLLGSLYQGRSEYEIAQNFYLKVATQYEDVNSKSRALIGAAQCAKFLKDFGKARELYREVISLRPNPKFEELARKEFKSLNLSTED